MQSSSEFFCPWCHRVTLQKTPINCTDCPLCKSSWTLLEHYRLDGMLGQGGNGYVYSATNDLTKEPVAIQCISLKDQSSWRRYEIFKHDGLLLKQLIHPSLPTIFDCKNQEDGSLILVRERLDGATLYERVCKHKVRFDEVRTCLFLREMLELLVYLHRQGFIHRDLHPRNIMFRTLNDWAPVLIDFDTLTLMSTIQESNTLIATPGYTALEQLAGQSSFASDLFSLGCLLLFAITGIEPTQLKKEKDRFAIPSILKNWPKPLQKLIAKLVEPNVHKRYQYAKEVLIDLNAYEKHLGTQPPKLRWWPLTLAASLVCLAVGNQIIIQFGMPMYSHEWMISAASWPHTCWINTQPPHAVVFEDHKTIRVGNLTKPLGMTPLSIHQKPMQPRTIRIEKEGFRALVVEVAPSELELKNCSFTFALTK